MCVTQAIDLADIKDKISPFNKGIYENVRKQISELVEDRELTPDIDQAVSLITSKSF